MRYFFSGIRYIKNLTAPPELRYIPSNFAKLTALSLILLRPFPALDGRFFRWPW
jgi:hypothetical protein